MVVGNNIRRLVFYPSDELAALLAEFSGRFGISRSVLVRRAVRQGLAAAVAELAEGGDAPPGDLPPAVAVSPASARSRLLGQLTDLISVVEYHHPDADPLWKRSRARSRRTSRMSASSSTRPSGRPCPRRCLIPIGRKVGAVAAPFRCALRCRSSRCRGDVAWPLPSPPSHATAEPFDRTTKVRLSRRQLVAEFDMSRAWIIRQAVATGLPVLVYQLRTAYDSGLMLHR